MKNALKKLFGQQSKPIHTNKTLHSSIKLENAEQQDVTVAFPQRYVLQNQQGCHINRGKKFNYLGQPQKGQSQNISRRPNPTD